MSRAVASSASGSMLFLGYRVRYAGAGPEGVGVIKTIDPIKGIYIDWPFESGWHQADRLIRVGDVQSNEAHAEMLAATTPAHRAAFNASDKARATSIPDGEGDALAADAAAHQIVDDCIETICSLVRIACQRDAARYRELLETVAMHLGDV